VKQELLTIPQYMISPILLIEFVCVNSRWLMCIYISLVLATCLFVFSVLICGILWSLYANILFWFQIYRYLIMLFTRLSVVLHYTLKTPNRDGAAIWGRSLCWYLWTVANIQFPYSIRFYKQSWRNENTTIWNISDPFFLKCCENLIFKYM
jgi:hypothetical protein